MRIIGRKGQITSGDGDFALDVASKTLRYLATLLGNTQAIPPKIGKQK